MGCFFYFLRERDPYSVENFIYALSRLPSYVACIKTCGPSWMGLRFKFPILWCPTKKYQSMYGLTKKVEKQCRNDLIACNGFRNPEEQYEPSFNLTHLHQNSFKLESNSEQLCPEIALFSYTYQCLFPCFTLLFHTPRRYLSSLIMDLNRYNLLFLYSNNS